MEWESVRVCVCVREIERETVLKDIKKRVAECFSLLKRQLSEVEWSIILVNTERTIEKTRLLSMPLFCFDIMRSL